MASPPAGMVTSSWGKRLRDEGCFLSPWVLSRSWLSPLVHLRLLSAAANSQLMPGTQTQPGMGKPHPGTFSWPFTTARLINCCLCSCLPEEKLSPLRQVASCQRMQSLLLLSLFSSAAHSQPSLQPDAAATRHKGWHLPAQQLGEQGTRAGLCQGFPGRAIDGRQRRVCVFD